jgi:hypothetical protein
MALTERQAQAIHEAGHAVAAHFRGFRIIAVQWVAGGARIGFDGSFDSPRSEQEAENALVVHVAGYAAMRKAGVADRPLTSEYLRYHPGQLARDSDPMTASVLVQRVFTARGEPSATTLERTIECVEAAERLAFPLLDQHWAAVEAVAEAMLASQNLTGEEVHRIIDQAPAAAGGEAKPKAKGKGRGKGKKEG